MAGAGRELQASTPILHSALDVFIPSATPALPRESTKIQEFASATLEQQSSGAPVPCHRAVEAVHLIDFTATYFFINFIDEKIHRAKTIIVL
jgi:hypothetical protein